MEGRPAWVLDAILYAGSALAAGAMALFGSIPIYREVSRLAAGPYAAGAVLAVALAVRGASFRARVALAVAVLAGSLVVPLALEVGWRASTDPGLHAQSEAIVTEEAAGAVARGRDPYAVEYGGALARRPTATRTHFPYLPGMLVFGAPGAWGGDHPWTDARVAFAATTLVLVLAALALWPGGGTGRLRVVQVLLVAPTGALLLATGGDDLPVVALMLLAVILLVRGRSGWAGVASGLAAATKQSAWLLIPFLVAAAWSRGRRPCLRYLAGAAVTALPILLAFFAWSPRGFVEDAVLFPLGLGHGRSPAQGWTLGGAVTPSTGWGRWAVAALLVVLIAVAALALGRRPRPTAAWASSRTGWVFVLAILLLPTGRPAYVLYPLNLLTWGRLLRAGPGTAVRGRLPA